MMPFQPGVMQYTQAFGSAPSGVAVPHIDTRAPTSSDVLYPLGQRWIWTGNSEYVLLSFSSAGGTLSANWSIVTSEAGDINTITTQDSTVVKPTNGNVNLSGAGSLTTVGSGSTATVELTGLTNHAVLVGAGTTTITKVVPSSTSGQVLQSAGSSADPAYSTATYPATTTINQILYSSAGNTVSGLATANSAILNTSSGGVPSLSTSPSVSGTITAGTGLTATTGAITATNGNIVMGTAGNKVIVPTGSNASAGVTGAMSGTPGAVSVTTSACSSTCLIFFCRAATGGTPGQVSITAQSSSGFTLTSTGNETSTFNWWIINV
jgi:hypothetical protein